MKILKLIKVAISFGDTRRALLRLKNKGFKLTRSTTDSTFDIQPKSKNSKYL